MPACQLPEGSARAFSGLIVVREDGGFLTDLRDSTRFDTVFSRLAHEMAHQWWPGPFSPAMSQGATALVEMLPQWTRLVAIDRQLGADEGRRFRASELAAYLRERTLSREREQPLVLADEPYLVSRKGSIILAGLRARLGEGVVNTALSGLAAEIARGHRTTTAADLRSHLLRVAQPRDRAWVAEQFDRVVLDDLEAEILTVTRTGGGYRAVVG